MLRYIASKSFWVFVMGIGAVTLWGCVNSETQKIKEAVIASGGLPLCQNGAPPKDHFSCTSNPKNVRVASAKDFDDMRIEKIVGDYARVLIPGNANSEAEEPILQKKSDGWHVVGEGMHDDPVNWGIPRDIVNKLYEK